MGSTSETSKPASPALTLPSPAAADGATAAAAAGVRPERKSEVAAEGTSEASTAGPIAAPGEVPGGAPLPRRVLRSQDLFEGAREVWIEHERELYRLQLTRSGKLILTK